MNILIIGGTGLISSAITRMLMERGDSVTHYNRGKTDLYPPPAGVKTVHGDRTDYVAFENQLRELGTYDCVMDMWGFLPGDGESVIRAFRGRTGHFIFCSTVDVYQKPATSYPYTEAEPYGGLNTYSRNKIAIEKILRAEFESSGFPVTIIRPAYTYGEGRGPIHSFGGRTSYLDRIRKGKPIVVHGDGSSFWVSCHRDDVARAFVHAAGQAHTFGNAYHTTGAEWLTWNQYHQSVATALGAPTPKLIHIPTDALVRLVPDRSHLVVENLQFNNIFDNAAAARDLNFQYTVSWSEGLKKMADWLDQFGRVENSDDDSFEDRLVDRWQSFLQVG